MKSMKVLGWLALVSVSALTACGGVSSIGSGDDSKGGSAMTNGGSSDTGTGASSGKGAESMGAQSTGATSMGGMPNIGGKDPMGMGATGGVEECKTDMECTDPVAPCEPCSDGSFACTKGLCTAGKCVYQHESCTEKCATDMDCPLTGVACSKCADGTMACPTTHCLMGSCQTALPGCGGTDPCMGQACGTECKSCMGPMCDSKELSYCSADGKCQPGLPQCGNPGMCKTVMDCGAPPPKCVPCGNDTCAKFDCINGSCVFACPPNPDPQCKTSEDCPVIGDQCKMCGSGKCAVEACLQGSCELVCPL